MSVSLSQAERQEIRQMFELFDVERTGTIHTKELVEILDTLESNSNNNKAFREVLIKSKCTQLNLESFTRLVTSFRRQSDDDWKHVFGMFDADGKGYISKQDLERVADSLGEALTNDEVEEMMLRASHNQNGKVTFSEFEAIMTKNLFPS